MPLAAAAALTARLDLIEYVDKSNERSYRERTRLAESTFRHRQVRFNAGVEVKSLHPSGENGWQPARRAQSVFVEHALLSDGPEGLTLRWPGSGGYWREVRARDVQLTGL